MRRHVHAHEAERGVVDVHAHSDAALIAHHAEQARCEVGCCGLGRFAGCTADAGNRGTEGLAREYTQEHAH